MVSVEIAHSFVAECVLGTEGEVWASLRFSKRDLGRSSLLFELCCTQIRPLLKRLPLEFGQGVRAIPVRWRRRRQQEGSRGFDATQPSEIRQGDLNPAGDHSPLRFCAVDFDLKELAVQSGCIALLNPCFDELQRFAIGLDELIEGGQFGLISDGIQIPQLNLSPKPQGPLRDLRLSENYSFLCDGNPLVALASSLDWLRVSGRVLFFPG